MSGPSTAGTLTRILASLGVAALKWIAAPLRWLFDQIHGSIPADFESAFNMDESVARLSAVTKWFAAFTSRVVAEGDVSQHFVSIHKPYSLFTVDFRGGFEPYFKGEFSEIDGRVRLSGRFTLGLSAKAFATVWLGFIVLWIGVTIRFLLLGDARTWWFPFAGLGVLALGAAYVMFAKRWARDDIRWLSQLIEDALSKKG